MSREERFNTRDLLFSRWHRTLPDNITCIDVDFLEYCQICREPLALIELARDVGQSYKPTLVLERLAKAAKIDAYLILYKPNDAAEHGIAGARVARVYPTRQNLVQYTMDEVERLLVGIHEKHEKMAHGVMRKPSA